MKIKRINPEQYPLPVGNYSHVSVIENPKKIYSFSGQIGVNADGELVDDLNHQVRNTLINIANLLKSQDLEPSDVLKVQIFAVEEIDWDYFYLKWEELFGIVYPSMTIVYVKALGLDEIKIELDLWATK